MNLYKYGLFQNCHPRNFLSKAVTESSDNPPHFVGWGSRTHGRRFNFINTNTHTLTAGEHHARPHPHVSALVRCGVGRGAWLLNKHLTRNWYVVFPTNAHEHNNTHVSTGDTHACARVRCVYVCAAFYLAPTCVYAQHMQINTRQLRHASVVVAVSYRQCCRRPSTPPPALSAHANHLPVNSTPVTAARPRSGI